MSDSATLHIETKKFPGRSASHSRLYLFPVFLGLLVMIFLAELGIGTVPISVSGVVGALLGMEGIDPTWRTIIVDLRLPRTLAAMLGGAALGVAGLQLQTLFKNPLAGPWALGLTAGAQLGVALVVTLGSVVGSAFLERLQVLSHLSIVGGAMLGCFLVLVIMMAISKRVSTITLLIFGLMLGYLAQGLISVILHFTTSAQNKIFAGWNDGTFASVYWEHYPILIPLTLFGFTGAWLMRKPLNAFMLGENYARSLGLSVKRTRLVTLACTVLLAGPVTAYCGPVLFIGLIAPHLSRGIFNTSDHRILMPASMLLGAVIAQAADFLVNLPWDKHFLHLNAVNALVGAPVVMWVILKNKKMRGFEL